MRAFQLGLLAISLGAMATAAPTGQTGLAAKSTATGKYSNDSGPVGGIKDVHEDRSVHPNDIAKSDPSGPTKDVKDSTEDHFIYPNYIYKREPTKSTKEDLEDVRQDGNVLPNHVTKRESFGMHINSSESAENKPIQSTAM